MGQSYGIDLWLLAWGIMLLLDHRLRIISMPRCSLLTVCSVGLAVVWYAMGHDLLVPRSGRRGGRSRRYGLSAVERVEGRMRVINAIHHPIGTVLRVGRRRRVRGRGGVDNGRHGVVQFAIAADKDGGGCTRIAPCLQHRSLAQYPQIKTYKTVHYRGTYQ